MPEDASHSRSITELLPRQLSRRIQLSLIIEGSLVGLGAGLIVALYRISLSRAAAFIAGFAAAAHTHPLLLVGWILAAFLLAYLVYRLIKLVPDASGSGIPQTTAEVMDQLDQPAAKVLLAKFFGGCLSALAGLSLGREGPSVQLGAMAGKIISRKIKCNRGEERLLVTCGAAAGMTAAFNAPLTGVLFAIEEIHKEFTSSLIISVMAASIASDLFVSQVLGVSPVLRLHLLVNLPHQSYLLILIFGILCGLFGAVHNLYFFKIQSLYQKIPSVYLRYLIPFLLSIPVAYFAPLLLNGGDAIADILLEQRYTFALLGFLLLAKLLFTGISFGSGLPGGTLFPMVVMGALLGANFGSFLHLSIGLPDHFVINFMVLGIAGLFASVVRSPVTAIVLAFELTGSLDTFLSAAVVAIISYVIANFTKVEAFYEELLYLLLKKLDKSTKFKPLKGKLLQIFTVGAESPAENKCLKDIEWPKDSRVVIIQRAGQDILPVGETRLQALDEVLVIMNANSATYTQAKLSALFKCKLAEIHTRHSELLLAQARESLQRVSKIMRKK